MNFTLFFVLFSLIILSFLIIFPNPNQLLLLQTLLLLNYSSWCFHHIVLKRCGPFCHTNTYAKYYVNYDKIADWMKLRILKFVFQTIVSLLLNEKSSNGNEFSIKLYLVICCYIKGYTLAFCFTVPSFRKMYRLWF